ncbi:MAG: TAXI family TRAP transporter solute-binding subunit [Geminicoccaceae bacterium]
MLRKTASLAVLIAVHLSISSHAIVRAADQLTLGTGQPGSESHQLGVGLTALVKVIVLPGEGIDLDLADEKRTLDDRHLLIDGQSALTTLLTGQSAEAFRSVMAFRSDADDIPLELIARADVSADVVYAIVKAIFENGPFLNTTSERVWDLSIDQTLRGLQLPVHPGAHRYYRERGGLEQQTSDVSPSDVDIPQPDEEGTEVNRESTFFIYFDGPHARLDRAAQDQVAAACRYATKSRTPQMQISGYSGGATSDASKDLAGERLQSVMAALGRDDNCGPDTSIVALDDAETKLPAELSKAGDDRVEITILTSAANP